MDTLILAGKTGKSAYKHTDKKILKLLLGSHGMPEGAGKNEPVGRNGPAL